MLLFISAHIKTEYSTSTQETYCQFNGLTKANFALLICPHIMQMEIQMNMAYLSNENVTPAKCELSGVQIGILNIEQCLHSLVSVKRQTQTCLRETYLSQLTKTLGPCTLIVWICWVGFDRGAVTMPVQLSINKQCLKTLCQERKCHK